MILTYLKRFYLVVTAIGATILFASFYNSTFTYDLEDAVASFESKFQEEEARLDKVLEFTSTRLNNGKIETHWESLNGQQGVNIHIYRNDSLIFWNTNQLPIIRFADIHFPAKGLVKLQNGWYYAKTAENGEFLVCVSFLIRNDYTYENQHLVNDFSTELPFPYDAEILPDEDAQYPIENNEGEYVCSVSVNEEQLVSKQQSVLLMILLLVALALWASVLFQFIRKKKAIWSWVSLAVILLVRIVALKLGWLSFMEETESVNASLYGVNDWLPNFLEYCVHLIAIVYVMAIFRLRIDNWKPSRIGLLASYVLPVMVVFPWILLVYFVVSLVENSAIPLGINQLFSLNAFSIIAIIGFGILFYSIFHVSRSVIQLSKRNNVLGSRSAVIYFAVSCIYLLCEINFGFGLLFAAVFPMMYF
jgi:hypothetical protein